MKEFCVRWETMRSGQSASYSDSIFEYVVHAADNESFKDIKRFCTSILHPCKNEAHPQQKFDGHCGFPFGLESFYAFRALTPGSYVYVVCEPYTG